MATQAEIRTRINDNLYAGFPADAPFVSRISVAYNNSIETITVLDGTQWANGDVLENLDNGENMKVVSKSGNVLTVLRGWNGSTPTASTDANDPVYKNPRFSAPFIDRSIESVLHDLHKWGIHIFGETTVTRVNPKEFYELAATDILEQYGVLKAYYVADNSELPITVPFRYHSNYGVGSTEYTQGRGVEVLDWGNVANGESLFLVYAKRIDSVTDLLDRQEQLVVDGACALLLGGTIIRATHDPGARTDRTVQPGQTSRDVRHFQGKFFTDARTEAAQCFIERQSILHETTRYARARRWKN